MSEIGLQARVSWPLFARAKPQARIPQNADGDGQKMPGANCFTAPINTLADQSSSHRPPRAFQGKRQSFREQETRRQQRPPCHPHANHPPTLTPGTGPCSFRQGPDVGWGSFFLICALLRLVSSQFARCATARNRSLPSVGRANGSVSTL